MKCTYKYVRTKNIHTNTNIHHVIYTSTHDVIYTYKYKHTLYNIYTQI